MIMLDPAWEVVRVAVATELVTEALEIAACPLSVVQVTEVTAELSAAHIVKSIDRVLTSPNMQRMGWSF